MEQFFLNRIYITGLISKDTPLCVVIEIAQSLNINIDKEQINEYYYYNRLIKTIKDTKGFLINKKETYTQEELQYIASFVNGNREIKWRLNPLLKSFNHLMEFYNKENIEYPESEFIIGQKTPDNIYALNACMLYRMCIFYEISLTKNTTIEEMGYIIKNYSKTIDEIREMVIFNINNTNKKNLLNLLVSNNLKISNSPNIKCPSVSKLPIKIGNQHTKILSNINFNNIKTNDLKITYTNLMDHEYYLIRLEPNTQEESIILAAIIYGINLTECINPFNEYNEIRHNSLNGKVNIHYIPKYDPIFRQKYVNNPKWYNIRYIWEPKLTYIYSKDNLIKFLKTEGYTNIEDNYEEMLYTIRLIPTFYYGKYPNCTVEKTNIYFEPISEINNDLLLSYGILESSSFIIFTVNELADYFTSSKTFINPCNNTEVFSENSINKLNNFCNEILNNKKKCLTEIENNYKKLSDSIELVKKFNESINLQSRVFRNLYISSEELVKKNINIVLNNLLNIGYYMRGWKIHSNNLPISLTTYDVIRQIDVELNSTNAIIEFEKSLKNLDIKTYEIFKNLPILCIKHIDSSYIFKPSNNIDAGLTILDRINIVKDGKTEHSCIRLSSNWILSSAFHYITICGNPEPFNILDMADIS